MRIILLILAILSHVASPSDEYTKKIEPKALEAKLYQKCDSRYRDELGLASNEYNNTINSSNQIS